jgi:hypothetical protein
MEPPPLGPAGPGPAPAPPAAGDGQPSPAAAQGAAPRLASTRRVKKSRREGGPSIKGNWTREEDERLVR